MSGAVWKAYVGGKKAGPVDEQTIREWISQGRVKETTQIWRPGMKKWQKAREVPEFAGHFGETLAAMPAAEGETAAAAKAEAARAAAEREAAEREAAERDAAERAAAEREAAERSAAEREAAERAAIEREAAEALRLQPSQVRSLYEADEAATVVQASPFLDVPDGGQAAAPFQPAKPAPLPSPSERITTRPSAPSPLERSTDVSSRPRPFKDPGTWPPQETSLPLMPILLSLLALVPAVSMGILFAKGLLVEVDPNAIPFYLVIGTLAGMVLFIILPLFYRGFGLWAGLLGALLWLGCWVGYVLHYPLTNDVALGDVLRSAFFGPFQSGEPAQQIVGVLNWTAVLVPLAGLVYYAATRKYRRRIGKFA